MGWTLFFMIVILKIPMIAALWLVWYAIKEVPEPDQDITGTERGPRRKPPTPRWPRRGPIVGGGDCKPMPCPQQVTERIERPAPAYARRPERV
jgi:hypothetical protein